MTIEIKITSDLYDWERNKEQLILFPKKSELFFYFNPKKDDYSMIIENQDLPKESIYKIIKIKLEPIIFKF